MESYNPTSQASSQSNIVPFQPSPSTFRLSRTAKSTVTVADTSIWERFWDGLFNLLMPRTEPRITQKQHRDGNSYYQVYDPISGDSKTFGSELETRIWLDKRFYQ